MTGGSSTSGRPATGPRGSPRCFGTASRSPPPAASPGVRPLGARRLRCELALPRPELEAAVDHVMGGFDELPVHPDVLDGVRALRCAAQAPRHPQQRVAAGVAQRLFERGRDRRAVRKADVCRGHRRWKPAPAAYAYAVRSAGPHRRPDARRRPPLGHRRGPPRGTSPPGSTAGAGPPIPQVFTPPTLQATDLTHLAEQLT